MVTSRDVARHAGVSQATVSRVINGIETVAPEIRERVRASMDATGFVLNTQAKAMRTSRSRSIGLVTSDIRNPYFPYLLDELTRAAHLRGYKAMVWDDTSPGSGHAVDAYASGAVDGLVLTSLTEGSGEADELRRRRAPFVLCNRAPDDDVLSDIVMADSAAMTRSMADYLIGAGRRQFAAVFGSPQSVATPARRRGFFEALQSAGIVIDEDLVVSGQTVYETGVAACEKLLATGKPFDTIYCGSDVIAFGVIDALRARGVSVPGDIWVTGVDGLPMSAWLGFDLTTIEQNVPEIARLAIERVISRIEGSTEPARRQLVPTRLMVRGSTAHRAEGE